MDIQKKIYRITDFNDAGLIIQQGIDKNLAIVLCSVPLFSLVLLSIAPIVGYRYFIYLLVILIYTFLFLPSYSMPYARSFRIDSEANTIMYIEEYIFLFFRPQKSWLEFLPPPIIYATQLYKIRQIRIDQYDKIQLLTEESRLIFPDLTFQDIYELTRAILRLYRVMDAEVFVKPWEGNYGNPYSYLERKLKDANVSFIKEKP